MSLQSLQEAQQTASNPLNSVWVSASAGTGKTKVLTDRLLRLLLQGCNPEKILCLTFTKAASAEMRTRLQVTLEKWVTMPLPSLKDSLYQLTNQTPSLKMIEKGRSLFYEVLQSPLKIQTLHSFCQSLLRRFPLEAGVSPHFPVLDGSHTRELFHQALRFVYEEAQTHPTSLLRHSLDFLFVMGDPGFLPKVLTHPACRSLSQKEELSEEEFSFFLAQSLGVDQEGLVLDPKEKELYDQKLFEEKITSLQRDEETLRQVIPFLRVSREEKEQLKSDTLERWLQGDFQTRVHLFPSYESLFLKQDGFPLKTIVYARFRKEFPWAAMALEKEALLLSAFRKKEELLRIGRSTKALWVVSCHLQKIYKDLKVNGLDYEDLIRYTCQLLEKAEAREWVKYKLDGGIDHILIDEAQDTSPSQWQIITSLCEEFFSGYGSRSLEDLPRSLFVVGDSKQSIYSFQGADPHLFGQMNPYFQQRVRGANLSWQDVYLTVSFRSLPPLLHFVDQVFADSALTPGVLPPNGVLESPAFRGGDGGKVEIWPLVTTPSSVISSWEMPLETYKSQRKEEVLAERIACQIREWLDEKRVLSGREKPLQAGDIVVLVRRRNAFVPALVRALKRKQIPVAGMDRLVLLEQLCILDLLGFAECLHMPQDDLTLATVLKSPFIGISEEKLFELAYNREEKSLWERLEEKSKASPFSEAWTYLKRWQKNLRETLSPHDFFMNLLLEERPALVTRLGPETHDILDEFLEIALTYEQTHVPSISHFLLWIRRQPLEIKRDLSSSQEVRIMTVHGSKGLQAPIVFLADTVSTPSLMHDPLSFLPGEGLCLPLYSPGGWSEHPPLGSLREAQKAKLWEEYYRLLYVALTRAEDELYITGWEETHSPAETCWYELCRKAFARISEVE